METFNYPPPPPPPVWQAPARPEVARGISIAALVCGIVGVVVGLIPLLFVATLALGAVAFILGSIAWYYRRRAGLTKALAVWGTILGVLALTLGIVGAVIVNSAVNDLNDQFNELDNGPQFGIQDAGDVDGDGWDECIMAATTDAEHEACYAAGSNRSTDSSGWVGP